MEIDLNRFRAAFFEEAGEHLENMEGGLLALETSGGNREVLDTIFRAAHSIKGASSTFGMDDVARFTHVLENLLDRMRDGEILQTPDLCELLLMSTDVLAELIEAEKNQSPPPDNVDDVYLRLQQHSTSTTAVQQPTISNAAGEDQSDAMTVADYVIDFRPSRTFFQSGLNPLYLIEELQSLSTKFEVQLDTTQLPSLSSMDPEASYFCWTIRLTTSSAQSALQDVFLFVDDQTLATIQRVTEQPAADAASLLYSSATPYSSHNAASADTELPPLPQAEPSPITGTVNMQPLLGAAKPEALQDRRAGSDRRSQDLTAHSALAAAKETVRVDRERLDKMINQIGELVIGTSMVEQDWSRRHPDSESTALVQLGKIVRDLQEMSLSLRMVPIATTFQKMARVIRDLSMKLGKQIRLETEGEETELDKTVVDQIGDPLMHMVRNSVDHGIESAEQRAAAGKSPEGCICLKAYHQGGNFIIEIQDDGGGLDRDRILKKAIERGIVSASDNLSDEDIYGLIFAAGFSTAEQVTDVSGRGVGMDVVRRNVEALQGSISIRSKHGQGCRIIVRLPLTLAILDGLLVRVANSSYVIPLLSVVESIKPNAAQIKRVLGKGEIISLRGEVVPLMRLEQMLNASDHTRSSEDGLLVIVEDQGRKYSLVVDELLGQQQVVIKNLEANFQKVPGVAGATILGDGRVALILDINGLHSLAAAPFAQALAESGINRSHSSIDQT